MVTRYELILKRESEKKMCSYISNFDAIIDVTANKKKVLRVYRNTVRAVGTRYEVTMEKIKKCSHV